jgi:hypothetical protein
MARNRKMGKQPFMIECQRIPDREVWIIRVLAGFSISKAGDNLSATKVRKIRSIVLIISRMTVLVRIIDGLLFLSPVALE